MLLCNINSYYAKILLSKFGNGISESLIYIQLYYEAQEFTRLVFEKHTLGNANIKYNIFIQQIYVRIYYGPGTF